MEQNGKLLIEIEESGGQVDAHLSMRGSLTLDALAIGLGGALEYLCEQGAPNNSAMALINKVGDLCNRIEMNISMAIDKAVNEGRLVADHIPLSTRYIQ